MTTFLPELTFGDLLGPDDKERECCVLRMQHREVFTELHLSTGVTHSLTGLDEVFLMLRVGKSSMHQGTIVSAFGWGVS